MHNIFEKQQEKIRGLVQKDTAASEKKIRIAHVALLQKLCAFMAFNMSGSSIPRTNMQRSLILHQVEQMIRETLREITPIIKETIWNAYKNCHNGFLEITENLLNEPSTQRWVTDMESEQAVDQNESGYTLSDSIDQYRLKLNMRLRRAILRGFRAGKTYEQIAKEVGRLLDMSYRQIRGILRTTAHTAQEAGFFDAAAKSNDSFWKIGLMIVKVWVSRRDKKVRDAHRQHSGLDGQRTSLFGKFTIQGHTAFYPGGFGVAALDCNCRCFVVYAFVTMEEKEAAAGLARRNKIQQER